MRAQDLFDELDRLQDSEEACNLLRDVLDDESQELDLDHDGYQAAAHGLAVLSDVLARRVMVVNELLEAEANQAMDRFRRHVR